LTEAGWQNWSGRVRTTPARLARPRDAADLAEAVRAAAGDGLAVKAVGATHSHSPVAATDGLLVDTSALSGLVSVDTRAMTATVGAGSLINSLGDDLLSAGVGLMNQGDIDVQSVAGACATATHGTGRALQNLSAAVVGAQLVTASGQLVSCSSTEHPDLWAVARTSLGAVGVLTEVTLAVRPAYRLHERLWREDTDAVLAHLDELVAATRHFELFWFGDGDWCACKSLDETDEAPGPVEGRRHERVDWSHRIFPSVRDERHTEMEYAVPAEAGPECFGEIRRLVLDHFAHVAWPVEYRTLAADDVWMSPAQGRDTVTISVHHDPPPADDRRYYRAAEEIFAAYDGRPHWGKVHFRPTQELARLHPCWEQWWAGRDSWDPDGRFLPADLTSS